MQKKHTINIGQPVLWALSLMLILQIIREVTEALFSPLLPSTRFCAQMLTMTAMFVLTFPLLLLAKRKNLLAVFFPQKLQKKEI